MSTNPNFPRRDAPPLPSEAGADETYVPEGEVVSAASKGKDSNGGKTNGAGSDGGGTSRAKSEDEIKKHDPEKFGSFTLPPDFLKEALSQPLPKAKEEDLAHDTLAPYREGGEVHRQIVDGKKEHSTLPDAPRAKMASRPAENHSATGRAKSKKKYAPVFVAVGLVACFAIGGMLGIFERQDGEVEIEAVSPKDDGSAESKASAKPSASEQKNPPVIEDSGEGTEGEKNPRADAPRHSASNGSQTAKTDSSKAGVAASPRPQPKSQQAPDPDEAEKASSETVAPRTIPLFENQ